MNMNSNTGGWPLFDKVWGRLKWCLLIIALDDFSHATFTVSSSQAQIPSMISRILRHFLNPTALPSHRLRIELDCSGCRKTSIRSEASTWVEIPLVT
ncbi:hypothetical protein AVEN_266-1 [Araneus ventricosus]|uniref:Uncharacterized protein n=1 Tax=Araneus ventricosus TaxID=182803 RepID=A0A4Y2CQ25_ARAVE|nr:hypothetical protein AVEN_266-1 [Araneus ventricosus]